MTNPLFVQTSIGWINLALVKWMTLGTNGKMRLIFSNVVELGDDGIFDRECVDLDMAEFNEIMSKLMIHDRNCVVGG